MSADAPMIDEQAADGLAVAPPPPGGDAGAGAAADGGADAEAGADAGAPPVREAMTADDVHRLRRDPSDEDAKLDVALDESFPTSDAPSNTQPGKGKDPAPSSGYDAEAERARSGGG